MDRVSELLGWVARSYPAAQATLRAGATPQAIERVRVETGHPLPEALAALWRAHDGQRDGFGSWLFDRFAWLSVAEALAERGSMTRILAEVARDEPSVRGWPSAWLPFARDAGGGFLVADLVSGEVLESQYDDEDGGVPRAASFELFIDDLLARISSGELRIDPTYGLSPAIRERLPPAHEHRPVPTKKKLLALSLGLLYALALGFFVWWLETHRG